MASSSGLPSLPSLGGSTTSSFFSPRSSTKSGGFFNSGKFKPMKYSTPGAGKMTAQQALMAVYLHNQAHPHRSFLGKIVHGATHGVESALDFIARPSYAIASGTYDATKHGGFDVGQFLHGASQGIQGKDKKGFGQVLAEHHILDHHGILRGIAGFTLDVASDPLTYASLGGSSAASIAAKEAEMGLAKGTLRKAIEKTSRGAFTSSKEAQGTAELLKKAGLDVTAGLAHAHQGYQRLVEKGLADTRFGSLRQAQLHGLEALSQHEVSHFGTRLLAARYKIPFGPAFEGTIKAGSKTFKAPSLLRIADEQGILGKMPGLPRAAETVGKVFKPGWRNEKMHALEIMSKHLAELRQDEMVHMVQRSLIPSAGNLSQEEMRHALKWGETHPGIVKMRPGRSERILSKKMLSGAVKSGELSGQQAEFLAAWHATTEALRKADAEFGVKYDAHLLKGAEDNIVYVPHVREAGTGVKVTSTGSALTKKGFQYERKAGPSQMALLDKIVSEQPELAKDVISNPLEMMARRAQTGAIKQSQQYMTDLVAKTFGVPTRLPNIAEQLRLGRHYSDLNDAYDKLRTITNKGLADTHLEALQQTELERQAALEKAGEFHAAKEAALKKQVATAKGLVTKASKKKVPTARQFLAMKNEHFTKLLKGMGKHPLRAPLATARAHHKALDTLERAVVKSVHDSLDLAPVSGKSPHGSKYKALVGELLNKADAVLGKDEGRRNTYLLRKVQPRDSWEKRHSDLVEELLAEVKNGRSNNANSLQQALDKHFGSRAKTAGLKQALSAKQRALEKHQGSWDQVVQKIDQRSHYRLTQRQLAIGEQQQKELRKAAAIDKAMKRIERQVERHNTSVKNPKAYAPGLKVSSRLKAANGSPLAIPSEMEEALTRSTRALQNDEFLAKFENAWQKLVAQWKVGVTVVNPGYRIRNTLSDLWNAYISPKGGVPVWAMLKYGGKAAHMIQVVRHLPEDPKTWTAEQRQASRMFVEMYHHGVLAGLFQGDLEKVRRFLEGKGSAKELAKGGHPLRAFTKIATDFNRHAENWGRMMHYLYRRESQKLGAGEAASIVRAAHFDYEDLTPSEQAIKRWAVPFYTWTRKNMPYQVSRMVQSPGRYAAFPLLANESNNASPQVKNEIVPSWIKQGLGFHVPFGGKGNFYLPVFGPVDLEKAQHPLGQGLSMLSPMLQIPIELAANKNLNTDQPIYGSELAHPRTPISGFAASVLRAIPGTNVGPTERTVNGKQVQGPGANPLVSYLAQQTPLSNFLVNAESNIKKAQRGGGNKAALSEFGGISTYKPDQAMLKTVAQLNAQQGFKQYLRGLRDEHVIPEAKKRKVSAAGAANNRSATIAFGGR